MKKGEPVRLVADESCDFAVVRALRAAGYQVQAIAERTPRLRDAEILEIVAEEPSLLLTEDKDFGQLVVAARREGLGIVLIRYPASARGKLPEAVLDLLGRHGDELLGRFVVLQPGRVRIRRV